MTDEPVSESPVRVPAVVAAAGEHAAVRYQAFFAAYANPGTWQLHPMP